MTFHHFIATQSEHEPGAFAVQSMNAPSLKHPQRAVCIATTGLVEAS
jgi:hypothetical protein